jgi:hypothetical protein
MATGFDPFVLFLIALCVFGWKLHAWLERLAPRLRRWAHALRQWTNPMWQWVSPLWRWVSPLLRRRSAPPSDEEVQAAIVERLARDGYRCQPELDVWTLAEHPTRPPIHIAVVPFGALVVSYFGESPNTPERCLEGAVIANRCNRESIVAKFALVENDRGEAAICVTGHAPLPAGSRAFTLFLTTWHRDIGLIERALADLRREAAASVPEDDDAGDAMAPAPPVTH